MSKKTLEELVADVKTATNVFDEIEAKKGRLVEEWYAILDKRDAACVSLLEARNALISEAGGHHHLPYASTSPYGMPAKE